jgi:hypothetical protein
VGLFVSLRESGRVLEPARDASALLLLLSAIDVIVDVV